MKKILFSILLVLLLKENAIAKKYYSDYSAFSDYNLEKKESSDLVNVETKKVYNKYFNVAEGDYYALGENPVIYPYINVNIYKDTDYTEWSTDYPVDKLGRLIETKMVCDDNSCTLNHQEYRYKDRMYYHYCERPKLLSEQSALKGYIKDENDYTMYYRYQVRNKIEIEDEIVILNKSDFIDNYINSTVPYKLVGDIDYQQNGTYYINVETDFVTIPVSVEVLIIDNVINSYDNLLLSKELSLNNLSNKIKEYQKDINLKEEEISNLNHRVSSLESSLVMNNKQRDILISENNNLNSQVNKFEQDYSNCKREIINYKNINSSLELSVVDLRNKVIDYKNINSNLELSITNLKEISLNKENIIKTKNDYINKLDTLIKNYELEINGKEDTLKKLNLCNEVNNNLEKEMNSNKVTYKQNVFYVLFIDVVILLTGCAIIKIKSMKKKN